jgi:hypothetical protein
MHYFDYQSIAREANIPDITLKNWLEYFRKEYPGDEMMVELRMLRACEAAKPSALGLEAVEESLKSTITCLSDKSLKVLTK